MSAIAVGPATQLLGRVLAEGWRVVEAIPKNPYSSGGNFSDGYIVESATGSRAYLKAMDLISSLGANDPVGMINFLTESFLFERKLVEGCRDKRLDRVVTAITSGQMGNSPNDLVFYLIFELAESDVRSRIGTLKRIDAAWNLRILHHVAVALRQLHGQQIAHQDVKPSNVLLFTGNGSKIADLGRASVRGGLPPCDEFQIAGDKTYAPLELLYGHVDPDWGRRRFGCDLYLFGSLILSLFTGFGMTHLVMTRLRPELKPGRWTGTYHDVLPFLENATADVVRDFERLVDAPGVTILSRKIMELCNPNPAERGHPKERMQSPSQFSLERYVTDFNLLAHKAELGVFR